MAQRMNRRNFFKTLLAAAGLGAARVYAPAASIFPRGPKAGSVVAIVNAQTYEALQREAERELMLGPAAPESFTGLNYRYEMQTSLPPVKWRRLQNG